MTHVTPNLDQDSFRGRNDDGSESAATWKATANTNWSQLPDENFRVRFLVQEDAGGAENNVNLQLQYNHNAAGWNNVSGTSTVVQASASANFADDDDTTQQIGTGTFITPNSGMDENNGLAGESGNIDFSGNDEVEVEYCCQILSADTATNDTIELRVVRGDGTVLETYTNTPSITVDAAAQTVTVGLAVATTSGLAVSAERTHAVGLAAATTSALAASAERTHSVGQALATSSALAVTHSKAVVVGLVSIVTSALTVGSAKTQTVGQAIATTSAFAVTFVKGKVVGLATATTQALSVTSAKAQSVGLSVVTTSALAVSALKTVAVGLVSTTISALSVSSVKIKSVLLASISATALSVSSSKAKAVGLVSTTDTAHGVIAAKAASVVQAITTATAFSVTSKLGGSAVGQAVATTSAFSASVLKTLIVGQALVTTSVQGVTAVTFTLRVSESGRNDAAIAGAANDATITPGRPNQAEIS